MCGLLACDKPFDMCRKSIYRLDGDFIFLILIKTIIVYNYLAYLVISFEAIVLKNRTSKFE